MATDKSFITLLEAVDKRTRITSTGGEIVTTFYVEPASAAPAVVSRLLGYVVGNGINGAPGTTTSYDRHLPAADYDYPFYYCVEAHPTPFDRRSVTSSPAMLLRQYGGQAAQPSDIDKALSQPIIFDGPQSRAPDGTHTNDNSPNMCGAYVEAIYRPLLSIYNGPASGTGATPQNAFDYVDPQFHPCSRTFPANGVPGEQNSFVLQDVLLRIPVAVPNGGNSALLVTETWQEFTIRRVMCPTVPWDTIRQLTSRINGQKAWAPANMTVPGLPNNTFPQGTLRFDSAEPIMRTVPKSFSDDPTKFLTAADGLAYTQSMQWWDIIYTFSWRTTYALWTSYGGIQGQTLNGPGYIPWNCDWYIGADVGLLAGAIGGFLLPGWYEMTFEQPTNPIISFNTRRKYLDAEDPALPINKAGLVAGANHPFDQLFLIQAP